MKAIIIFVMAIFFIGCGGQPNSTCSEMVTDLYAIPDCALWNIGTSPPRRLTASQALFSCRKIVGIVDLQGPPCQKPLQEYLNCRPTKCEWNEGFQVYLADDCNDEMDRLVSCVVGM